jgi:hypothetical protein
MNLNTSMTFSNQLNWIAEQVNFFRDNWDHEFERSSQGAMLGSPFGQHGYIFGEDEQGDEYVTIGFVLPEGVYAEIEDGTYGQLQGLRIYRDGAHD